MAVVLFLIEHGADVNSRRYPRKYSGEKTMGAQTVGTTGSTPLHFAAANGCLAIVEVLLRHGAIADLTDKYGSSPLSVAIARNHPEVASVLHMHSSMQRGIQATAPDSEINETHSSPRNSIDLGRRVSALAAPTRPTIHQKDSSSQSTPAPSTYQTHTRNPGQRRISLPSIVESPSSPIISTAPRQSCDFGRTPLSTEPLHKSMESVHLRGNSGHSPSILPSPVKSSVSTSTPSARNIATKPVEAASPTPRTKSESRRASTSSHDAGKPPKGDRSTQPVSTPDASIKRRRSMEAAGFLSPQSAMTINRRRSFEQVETSRPRRLVEGKPRRTSDASTGSQNTVVSGHSSCVTLVDMTSPQRDHQKEISEELLAPKRQVDSGTASLASSPVRSIPQPCLDEDGSKRRASFAFETSISRPSLDQRRPLHITDDPDKAYRRRTLHAHTSPELSRVQLGSSWMDSETKPRKSTSSIDYQEAMPRHSFSGSSTISGRFSRMWSYSSGKDIMKDSGTAGNWKMGEFAEASGEAAAQSLIKPESTRSKASMLHRLSGIWKRS
ncbi:hypothetical protein MVEG_10140 [Podila verticillata NRRL 6337]|nr:hypothetical protein MVEG_10140 [Podila verticillata NRRL 6337]